MKNLITIGLPSKGRLKEGSISFFEKNNLKPTSDDRLDVAIIAPTIITDEIALVTDIKGVCNEGVTLHTT